MAHSPIDPSDTGGSTESVSSVIPEGGRRRASGARGEVGEVERRRTWPSAEAVRRRGGPLDRGVVPEGEIPEGVIPEGAIPEEIPEEIPEGGKPEEIPEGEIPEGEGARGANARAETRAAWRGERASWVMESSESRETEPSANPTAQISPESSLVVNATHVAAAPPKQKQKQKRSSSSMQPLVFWPRAGAFGAWPILELCPQLLWCELYDMRDIPKQTKTMF